MTEDEILSVFTKQDKEIWYNYCSQETKDFILKHGTVVEYERCQARDINFILKSIPSNELSFSDRKDKYERLKAEFNIKIEAAKNINDLSEEELIQISKIVEFCDFKRFSFSYHLILKLQDANNRRSTD